MGHMGQNIGKLSLPRPIGSIGSIGPIGLQNKNTNIH